MRFFKINTGIIYIYILVVKKPVHASICSRIPSSDTLPRSAARTWISQRPRSRENMEELKGPADLKLRGSHSPLGCPFRSLADG